MCLGKIKNHVKGTPQNSTHHSSFFMWCGKAAQVRGEWKGGESKPGCYCFSISNESLMKNLLFPTIIFRRERGTGKLLFTLECFAHEVVSALLYHWRLPSSPAALLLISSIAAMDFPNQIPSPSDFQRPLRAPSDRLLVLAGPSPATLCTGGAKCQHKWFCNWLVKPRHGPPRCSCLTVSSCSW